MLFPLRSKFFVSCVDGRVGSYMLTSMLNRHSQISCFGEIYSTDLVHGLKALPTWEFLNQHVYGSKLVGGFKLIHYQWRELPRSFAEELTRESRVIFLTRENFLDCYLSVLLARKNRFNEYSDQTVTIDPEQMRAYYTYRQRQEAMVLAMYKKTARSVLETTYERLVDDRKRAVEEICDFLYVRREALEPTTRKQRTRSKREAITNYEELRSSLPEFSAWFDSR